MPITEALYNFAVATVGFFLILVLVCWAACIGYGLWMVWAAVRDRATRSPDVYRPRGRAEQIIERWAHDEPISQAELDRLRGRR